MDILTLARELREAADLVVTDNEGRPLILVEIEPSMGHELSSLARLREHQRRFDFPFAMLADPERIWLLGPGESAEPIANFSTLETLKSYRSIHRNPSFLSKKDISFPLGRWLMASTEEFLTDRHENYCCFKKIGLAERMIWGHVLTEEMLFQKAGEVEHFF